MPAKRVASTYSIAGLTYESGCSASNTRGRLTSKTKIESRTLTKDSKCHLFLSGRKIPNTSRSTTRTGVADSPSSSAMAGQKALCQWKTASPLFVAIAKRFRGAGLQVFEELFAADF